MLDEEDSIGEALDRLLSQTCTDVEIVVADGGSSDRTREIVRARADAEGRILLIDNPRRLQSAGLNRALAIARSTVLVRLDGHSFVGPDYLARCADLLERTGAAVVGGRMVARPGAGPTAAAIALATGTWWAAGPARFHRTGVAGDADTVYLGAFRREAVEDVGGWAEDVGVNEDFDLNYRIRRAGGRVHYEPDLEVGYRPRASFQALAKQYWRYGRSKATMARRHPASLRARQAAPAALGLLGIAALLPGPTGRRARSLVVAHAAALALLASSRAGEPAAVRARLGGAALVMHWAWAVGFWSGVVRPFPPAR